VSSTIRTLAGIDSEGAKEKWSFRECRRGRCRGPCEAHLFSCDLNTFTQGEASVGCFGLQGSDKPRNARLLTRLSCPRTISSRYS
jgi:hypothetical protein